eukprot:TRINITY_DN4737_c0_g1_i1.p1 TRINITY_DN4737_c0_g1~~TRINITY_DN4737_c0_g1_i1.p1  ORF type:complete len:447 (+),score=87.40 TRINITY_DN4737_c0_g1_i1:60-1400(+)
MRYITLLSRVASTFRPPPMSSFFDCLFGFPEKGKSGRVDYDNVQKELSSRYDESTFEFTIPKGKIAAGRFEVVTVEVLRQRVIAEIEQMGGQERVAQMLYKACGKEKYTGEYIVQIANMAGEAGALHMEARADGAVMQAASQFNCLEFPSPEIVPEAGISDYIYDRTQGPACAIACPAGTAVRNYLVKWDDKTLAPYCSSRGVSSSFTEHRDAALPSLGQRRNRQIDCSLGLHRFLINCLRKDMSRSPLGETDAIPPEEAMWSTRNGYLDSDPTRLARCDSAVSMCRARGEDGMSELCGKLAVGVQWDTAVADRDGVPLGHSVTQVYSSAVAVGYSCFSHDTKWAAVAQPVLNGTYEATLLVGLLQNFRRLKAGKPPLPIFLTKVGGGVFANPPEWIMGAIHYARTQVGKFELPMVAAIVHFREIERNYVPMLGPAVSDWPSGAAI